MNVNFGELTWVDIRRAVEHDTIIVLPLGCIEQHGPHLPLDCDARSPAPALVRAWHHHAVRALTLPVLPFGPADEHMGFPGTISLPHHTWLAVIREIIMSLLHHGFRRIVVLPGCGGHVGLDAVTKTVSAEQPQAGKQVVVEVAPLFAAEPEVQTVVHKHFPGSTDVHAGESETSVCLACRPHLVVQDRIPQATGESMPPLDNWTRIEQISADGATGQPSRASAEAGREIAEAMEVALADWLGQFDARTRQPQMSTR